MSASRQLDTVLDHLEALTDEALADANSVTIAQATGVPERTVRWCLAVLEAQRIISRNGIRLLRRRE